MRSFERVLVRVDQPPWAELLRLIVGYLIVPTWARLTGEQRAGWTVIPFFLGVLVAFRIGPAVLRKLLPFGGSVQAAWADRRELAKRFDSYQWQKLFWIGLGLSLYTILSAQRSGALVTLTLTCLLSGASGLAVWRYRAAQLESRRE